MDAAIQARRLPEQQFRSQFLPEQGSALIDPSPIVQQLKNLTMSGNDTVRGAAKKHLGLINEYMEQNGGKIPATALDDIRQGVNSTLASVPNNGAVTAQEIAKYGPVSTAITDTLDRAIPGYRDNLAAYARASEPINTMESVGRLLDPNAPGSLNTAGDPILGAARLKSALRGDDKARYPMSDDARRQLEGVRESLARRSISDNKLAASGPGTAADLQAGGLLSGAIFGPTLGRSGGWLGRAVGSAAGGAGGGLLGGPAGAVVGASIGSGISDGIGAVNSRVVSRVGESAANSQLTAEAIEAYLRRQKPGKVRSLLENYLLPYETP